MSGGIRVVETGWSTTIQDRGREGFAHLGVPRAGAVDAAAQALANRLVGNNERAATLETAGGLVVEAMGAVVAATSGDGIRHTLQPGERVRVDPPHDGVWGYLAVRGGIIVDAVLGSRSHDTLSGVGPPAIRSGDRLAVGDDPHTDLLADHAPVRPLRRDVRLWPGPRAAWFRDGLAALVDQHWQVGRDVSRVGARLSVGRFEPSAAMPARIASEGLVVGAVQITPGGEPIVMLANHPTTGGYPVLAVVEPDDIANIAQAPPGTTIRFRHA
jgi:biotin-dependent carboxylase-like uncharacterized protein